MKSLILNALCRVLGMAAILSLCFFLASPANADCGCQQTGACSDGSGKVCLVNCTCPNIAKPGCQCGCGKAVCDGSCGCLDGTQFVQLFGRNKSAPQQCGPNGCTFPSASTPAVVPAPVAMPAKPAYQWVASPGQPNSVLLLQGGKQVGGWYLDSKEYLPLSGRAWGKACPCPTTPPTDAKSVSVAAPGVSVNVAPSSCGPNGCIIAPSTVRVRVFSR